GMGVGVGRCLCRSGRVFEARRGFTGRRRASSQSLLDPTYDSQPRRESFGACRPRPAGRYWPGCRPPARGPRMPARRSAVPLAVFFLSVGAVSAGDWPGWRGPTGMGQTSETGLPLTWGGKADTNVIWKVPLPGTEANAGQDQNQSSPVVSRGRVFVTASYWPGGKPDNKRFPEHHVACYQAADGKRLWDVTVPPGPWLLSDLRGGYTAPTPAADGERVYVVFGSSVIAALDYAGSIVWRKEITPYKFDVAIGASPVLFGETVILQCDQVDRQSRMVAFDRKTGDVKW